MTLNDLCARFKVIDSFDAAKMVKYSLVMNTGNKRIGYSFARFALLLQATHRRIYHWAIWAMPPPPLDSEKILHMVKMQH